MTRKNTRRGFTLIELLVVVLIVAILAAVALPQYQLAVMKTKFANLYNISRVYQRAAQEYIVSSGSWPHSFDDLSIDAPAGFTTKSIRGAVCMEDKEFYCCIKSAEPAYHSSGIVCGLADYSLAYGYNYPANGGEHFCFASETDSVANRLCDQYVRQEDSTNLLTPTGYKWGYYKYKMPKI